MSSVTDSLKLYFQNNSREQIEIDWSESDKFKNNGIKISEFLELINAKYLNTSSMKITYKERSQQRLIEYRNSPIYKTVMAIIERLKVKCPEIEYENGLFTCTTGITLTVSSYEHKLIQMHRKIQKENKLKADEL